MQRRKQLERKLEQQQNKIIKLERELTKAYEVHVQIQEEIDALDAKELFEAFKKSNKSKEQLMTFLNK